MRTENSIKNSILGILSSFVSILIGFFAQKVFIKILGSEYLGVNGLFSNILSMLSVAELGIGGAIIYNLYKPIAENDIEKVKSLLKLYKTAYNWIALIIFSIGICITPFIHIFIGQTNLSLNFKTIYILFLLQTVVSYLLTYKRSMLYAYQKNYIISGIHIIYLIVLNTVQVLLLYFWKNYYLYLIIKIIFVLLENCVINIVANKLYPFIIEKNTNKLEPKVIRDIFTRVKAQVFHTIGGVVVNSTDNIIISKFLGVYTVGLYSNYYLIINSVKTLFSQLISSTTASVGNLLVESDPRKSFDIYKKIRFINFWMAVFCSISILVIMNDFIILWIGENYLLSMTVLVVLVLNLYQKMMRNCNDVFLIAAGICIENRFVPIVESIINIISSVILVKVIGLAGVFIGTIISGLTLWCYSYPKFAYKKLFKRNYSDYAKETIGYILIFILLAAITYFAAHLIVFKNTYLNFAYDIIIVLLVPNILLFIMFRKTDNFKYFKNLLKRIVSKK